MQQVRGVVRTYDWGDPEWIPRMLGRPPDGTPHAELWFGTHPSAACDLAGGGTLADAVAADPVGTVGDPSATALPFLVKVLAAAGPLSIQVHPDAQQAAAGFAAEEAAGTPVDAPHRTYRDDQPKPELICALTPFRAKCGLRDPDRSAALVDRLVAAGAVPLAPLADHLAGGAPAPDRLRRAVAWLLHLDRADAAELVQATARAAAALEGGPDAEVLSWTARLAGDHPDDVGVVVALLLNHVELQPGEALFLAAGNLHSYLEGVAVEVMAPSDNVVRGGLTSKHVDTTELLRLLDPTPMTPAIQRPASADHRYDVPGGAFGLRRIDLDEVARATVAGPAVLLATQGSAVLGGPEPLILRRGHAAWVPAADGEVELTGQGVVHLARG